MKGDCSSFRIKNPVLCNKFHCFNNDQTLALFFFSQHGVHWTAFYGLLRKQVIYELTNAGFNIFSYYVE